MSLVCPVPSVELFDTQQVTKHLRSFDAENDDVDDSKTVNNEIEELIIAGESFADRQALARCLSPMLTCMKVLGAYFSNDTRSSADEKSRKRTWKENGQLIYCITMLALLWLNAARSSSIFTASDVFGLQFCLKLATMALMILCAILHTSYFIASHSGNLDRIINELRIGPESVAYFRKFVVLFIAQSFVILMICILFFIYIVFLTNGSLDFLLAPFVTQIPVNVNMRFVIKFVYMICFFHMVPSWVFLQMMNHMLAVIFHRQFSLLNNRFKQAIDKRGRFKGDLKIFRQRHHRLCQFVKLSDGFFMFGNLACFLCHAVIVIVLLFSLLFCNVWDPLMTIGFSFIMVGSALGLIWATTDSIMVNHEVKNRLIICSQEPSKSFEDNT
jgi:hypothetical protein